MTISSVGLRIPQKECHLVPVGFLGGGVQEAVGNLLPSSGERSG